MSGGSVGLFQWDYAEPEFLSPEWLKRELEAAGVEGTMIVQWGLAHVRLWLGEITEDQLPCDCLGHEEPMLEHHRGEHKHDCQTAPPCGGCMRCIGQQWAYFESKEQQR